MKCRELLWFVEIKELVVQSATFSSSSPSTASSKINNGVFSTARIISASLCCPTESILKGVFKVI
jgi:hypothetical protein